MKHRLLRYLAYTIELIVFSNVVNTQNLLPVFCRSKPMFLILISFFISIFEGKKTGVFFGILTGILMDISFQGKLGFYLLIIPIFGFILGEISERVIKQDDLTSMIVCFFSVVVFVFLEFLILYVFKGYDQKIYTFFNYYLTKLVYTTVFIPVVYFFNKAFASNIREREKYLIKQE